MRQLQAASARRPGAAAAGLGAGARARRRPGGADPAHARRRRRPADLRQRLQRLRRAVPARRGPGRERERRDGHRRDHLRRQRRARGAGRRPRRMPGCSCCSPRSTASTRARRERRARSCSTTARSRPRSGWAAGPDSAAAAWGARSRPRSSPPAPGIPTVIASGQADDGARADRRRRAQRHPLRRRRRAGEPAFKLWIRYGKRPRGRVVLDAGAERALRAAGASVLAVGVDRVRRRLRPGRRDRARVGERRPDRQGHRLDRRSRGRLPGSAGSRS